ncbi:putative hydroxypyruvate isomerase [Onchocerca flexuosa]|uniref:Putative hydroxypyruvate isomerase n=1 Tax=Onchocerca flexuosa TaxID=387005 RepID=A0A238BZF9_9BILA|nr:putative hydroxypyruvate isomerase [Onchocerca flexuosa]
MRVAANLTMMFPEMDLQQKYEKVAELGFQLVEVSLPYGWPVEELQQQAEHYRLKHILINAPAGNWSKGFRGLAALSQQKSEYIESLNIAVQYAKKLNVQKIHVMAGIAEQTDKNYEVYVENIRLACQQFKKESIICLIEPICKAAIPGYFMNSYSKALQVLKEVNEPNLKIMLDLFHAQQICGQLTATIETVAPFIGHIQVAQVPGRHEPDTDGEINYSYVFNILKKFGDWDVGCEYLNSGCDNQYLQWVYRYGLTF